MAIVLDGTNGINTPNTFAFKNRIINGGFTINQRGHTSGTALSSGSYGHDRWKGGASGGTYTFTQGSTGVNTTITITAGSIIQVIEGANLPEGGTYVLSWTGTAQGKIGSGSFGASGITGTITAGTNTNIEFNTGTCGNVQLEVGSTATSFDYRPYGTELQLCQRYYYKIAEGGSAYTQFGAGRAYSGTEGNGIVQFPVPMRSAPTFAYLGVVGDYDFSPTAISGGAVPASNTHMTVGMTFSSITSGSMFWLGANAGASGPAGFTFSAEL